MLDVSLLGTAGMMPLPYRFLTSLMARYNGSDLLIDCGEGTQVAIAKKGWSPHSIDTLLLTHYHADHVSGLPGLLLSMANGEKTSPLSIYGPKGLSRIVNSLLVIAPDLPFEISLHEINTPTLEFSSKGFDIKAFRVNHNVICYGYSLSVKRLPKFDLEAAKEKNIPLRFWNALQHGQDCIDDDGTVYTPSMVMGPPRKGLKVTYTTDTRPCQSIIDNAAESDLFICEGMYAEKEKKDNAKKNKHMMFSEAAALARDASVKELWLTHFSPSLMGADKYMGGIRKIFKNTRLGKDGLTKELKFEDEEE